MCILIMVEFLGIQSKPENLKKFSYRNKEKLKALNRERIETVTGKSLYSKNM